MPATIVSGGLIRETRLTRAIGTPLPYTETWTVSNHAGLNGDKSWTMAGAAGWAVNGQVAELAGTGTAAARGQCNVDCGTDDYQATISLLTYSPDVASLLSIGPCIRMQGAAELTFYAGVLVSSGSPVVTAFILKFLAGVQSQIGSGVPVTLSLPTTLALRGVGAALQILVGGLPIVTATDTASPILSGRFAGLQGVAGGTSLARADNLNVTVASSIGTVPLDILTLSPLAGVR